MLVSDAIEDEGGLSRFFVHREYCWYLLFNIPLGFFDEPSPVSSAYIFFHSHVQYLSICFSESGG